MNRFRALAGGVAAAVGLSGTACWLPAGPAAGSPAVDASSWVGASSAAGGSAVGDAAEAWYDTSPVTSCSSPIGCPPVTTSLPAYPAGTLHVGVVVGAETSRTYLLPDLSRYLGSTLPSAGTMNLPLATVSGNGNADPAAATIEACLSTGTFADGTAGSTGTPPAVDCSVHSVASFDGSRFTLDLGPFLAAWRTGMPVRGIALLPDTAGGAPAATWQVALDGRNLAGAAPITSSFSAAAPVVAPTVPASLPGDGSTKTISRLSGSTPPPAIAVSPGDVASPPVGPTPSAPELAAPLSAIENSTSAARSATATATAPARGGRGGFQYPEILLLPLVMAIAVLLVIRLLTSDATPKRLRSS